MKNNLILTIIAIVAVGGGAFYGGMKYQESRSPLARFGGMGPNGQRQFVRNGNYQNFRPVSGEVINIDDKSLTVKSQDGSSRIVILNDKTVVNKTQAGAISDIIKGARVMVVGLQNTDGSITAQSVQVNPALYQDAGRGASGK